MRVSAVVVAAGKGVRFSRSYNLAASGGIPPAIDSLAGKSKTPKVLAQINSRPVLIYSLLALGSHPLVKDIIVVVNAKNFKEIADKVCRYDFNKVRRIVCGGRRRQDSVLNGLLALDPATDLVLIHDAARPFINKGMISAVIRAARKTGAAIAGVPVKDTIKDVSRPQGLKASSCFVKKTLDRNNLWEIQTPQVFDKKLLLRAFARFGRADVTDEAALVEKLGAKVSVVLGSYRNIKITTVEDLLLAETMMKAQSVRRKA